MVTIDWCKSQRKGIELVEPNENLYRSYVAESLDTLEQMLHARGKWQVIMAYYAGYNMFYALLQRTGIKCEIHDCTLKLMELITGLSRDDIKFMVQLKTKRIDAQYYLKDERLNNLAEVKSFVFKVKEISETINIDELREKIKNAGK